MLKNILKLDGAQEIKKSEQKEITGGMLQAIKRCPYSNCICNGTPAVPIHISNCDGLPEGVLTSIGHCAVILINGQCLACI